MKIRKALLALTFAVLGLSACSSSSLPSSGGSSSQPSINDKNVLNVVLDYTGEVAMNTGDVIVVTPSISYKDDVEVDVEKVWTSTKTSVATVNNGIVTAVGAGRANITFRAGVKIAGFTVIVDGGGTPVPPQPGEFSVSVSPTSKSIEVGDTFTLQANLNNVPEGQSYDITFSSEDSAVASVDASSGLVTGVSVGSTNIVASANGKSAKCAVTVRESGVEPEDYDCSIYFFVDYNNIDENDETGTKLLAKFDWYTDRPISESGKVPADPTKALDKAFPYFIGWSSHTIIDSKDDLWDMEHDVVGNAHFIFLYGIWSDVTRENFIL